MAWSYNPETGEAFSLTPDGKWASTQTAKNPQTGESFVLDGTEWKPIPAAKPAEAPDRGTAINALRKAEFGSQGFIDRAAEIVTSPADLFWDGIRWVNKIADQENVPAGYRLPTPDVSASDSLKNIIHGGQRAGANLMAPIMPDMGPNVPETKGERVAMATGAGGADALSMIIPGGAVARGARAGSVLQKTGQAVAANPVAQMGAGAVGGGVTEETGNPLYGMAAAFATPGAARGVGGRIISPVRSKLNPEQTRLAAEAQRLGIPLTAAQRTGSRPLHSLESAFSTLPMTAGAQQKIKAAQQSAFNREALKHIGVQGEEATDDVLDAARQRIGGQIETLAAQTTVVPDAKFAQDFSDTITEYSRRLEPQRRQVFEDFVHDIRDFMQQGGMPGDIYQKARSQLSQMANSTNDGYFATALRDLRNTLDDAADRAMPAHLKTAWRDARREYGHLRTIEKSRSNTTTAAAGGDIPPTPFANAVRQANKRAYAYGAGGMNKLSKIGTTFVRDQIPNSGTPERLYWQNLLTNPLATLGATGVGMAVDPMRAGLTTAATLFGPRFAQAAYNSRPAQAWLTNQRGRQMFPQYSPGLLGSIGGTQLTGLLGP